MDTSIRNLMNIEEPYLSLERRQRLTHIPKRIGRWKAKISTKYQEPLGENHKMIVPTMIMDIMKEYECSECI